MIGKIFSLLCIISTFFGVFFGKTEAVSAAALDGAVRAVRLTFDLCGAMALWTGIVRVLEAKGAISAFSRLIRPFLRLIFPDAGRKNNGMDEISATLAANMLGIGNAATPLALSAMERLDENRMDDPEAGEAASDDMITFAVMNTAAFSLLPTTLVAMRSAAGSADPFSVIPAVWICSAASCAFSVLICRICCRFGRKKSKKPK